MSHVSIWLQREIPRVIADPVEWPGEHRHLRQIALRSAWPRSGTVLLQPAGELRRLRGHRARDRGQRQDEEQDRDHGA